MRYFVLLTFLLIFTTNQIQAQDWLIERSEWGSTDSLVESNRHTIEFITIHHGGEIFDDEKDTFSYLKNLQSWSRSARGWMDVPYHYIIDRNGNIIEGRPLDYRGDTNTTYDPTGHALVVLLGNFEEQELRTKQIQSLKTVTKFLADWKSVPAEKIQTHKDYAETLCPGKKLSAYLATNDWKEFLNSL